MKKMLLVLAAAAALCVACQPETSTPAGGESKEPKTESVKPADAGTSETAPAAAGTTETK